jgi:hypothetical protein
VSHGKRLVLTDKGRNVVMDAMPEMVGPYDTLEAQRGRYCPICKKRVKPYYKRTCSKGHPYADPSGQNDDPYR